VVIQTLATIGETSGRVGKGEGNVTRGSIYCRLPELGGRLNRLLGKSRRWSQFDAMARARLILRDFPDLRAECSLPRLGAAGGTPTSKFNLVGPDLSAWVSFRRSSSITCASIPGSSTWTRPWRIASRSYRPGSIE